MAISERIGKLCSSGTAQQLNITLLVSFTNTKLCEQQTKESVLLLIPLSQTSRIGENLNTVPEVRRVAALVEMGN